MRTAHALSEFAPQPASSRRVRVLTVSSNKGGVGKTTVAANLAIYFRALREDVPVLVVGLDDQGTLDRMFRLRASSPGEGNLKHAFAERSFDRVIQLGQYGVHFVPSPPDLISLKARAEDPRTLERILVRTAFEGIAIFDTKSDLEALTQNALRAADRVLVPVADWASLEEASKLFTLLAHDRRQARARVLLTLADGRTRIDDREHDLRLRLETELDLRGFPRCNAWLSRSPRVEALNSGSGEPLSILHHAQGTNVHRQMRVLAEEVLSELDVAPAARPVAAADEAAAAPNVGALRRRRAPHPRTPRRSTSTRREACGAGDGAAFRRFGDRATRDGAAFGRFGDRATRDGMRRPGAAAIALRAVRRTLRARRPPPGRRRARDRSTTEAAWRHSASWWAAVPLPASTA